MTSQISQTQLVARPAGMGDQCEEYQRQPFFVQGDTLLPEDGPLLVRCKSKASRRLTLRNGDDVYTVKFCEWHYERLRCQIKAGLSPVEILEDQKLGDHR